MDSVAAFIAQAQAKKGIIAPVVVEAEAVEPEWKFTKEAPQFADDGGVYRRQLLAPMFKRSRTVRVDEEDHEKIIDQ
jgi:hypothetical protein